MFCNSSVITIVMIATTDMQFFSRQIKILLMISASYVTSPHDICFDMASLKHAPPKTTSSSLSSPCFPTTPPAAQTSHVILVILLSLPLHSKHSNEDAEYMKCDCDKRTYNFC